MTTGKSTPKVVFVCAPGLPPLDMWLPVLTSLRKKMENAEFIFLAPKPGPIRQIDLADALHKIAAPIFDSIIFPDRSGKWKQVQDFENAKKFLEGGALVAGSKMLKKVGLAPILRSPWKVIQQLRKVFPKSRTSETSPLQALKAEEGVVLFDLFAANTGYVGEVLENLEHMPKFSMLHGLNVLGLRPQGKDCGAVPLPEKTTAFLFSEREVEFYRNNYGLADELMRVVGIPRHEDSWIQILSSFYEEKTAMGGKFIFVVSRGSDSRYFPRDMKVKALRDVHEAATAHGLKVVVRRHPKEADDGPYNEVFGKENLGKSWDFSNVHPIALGMHCEFAVTFYSGVAIDMVRLGTPVIERFEAHNLAKDFLLGSVEEASGLLSSPYSHLGLVLSARSHGEFMHHVDQVLHDRAGSLSGMRHSYQKIFPEIKKVNDQIASEIISSLAV